MISMALQSVARQSCQSVSKRIKRNFYEDKGYNSQAKLSPLKFGSRVLSGEACFQIETLLVLSKIYKY